MTPTSSAAQAIVDHCENIAAFSDEPGATTRTFLSPAMRQCLGYFIAWAERIGMSKIRVDAAGNFRTVLEGTGNRRLIIGSHIDTVPNAGAYDGVLGVVIAMALAEFFARKAPACTLEIVGFSEEEGVRFGRPFIGSVGFVDGLDEEILGLEDKTGVTIEQAIAAFGLDTARLSEAQMADASAYLEFHIEQGPLLESLGLPLGVVEAIAGQTRATIEFTGKANHAGTTPMNLRQDAFCAAAEWALKVERKARAQSGLVATVGRVHVAPGAGNIVPGQVSMSIDLRHADDRIRLSVFEGLMLDAREIGDRRNVKFDSRLQLNQAAVPMDVEMVRLTEQAVAATGIKPFRMTSGAGHDAMILAKRVPSGMIFLRSPGGVSHHPDETALIGDIDLALQAGRHFVERFV